MFSISQIGNWVALWIVLQSCKLPFHLLASQVPPIAPGSGLSRIHRRLWTHGRFRFFPCRVLFSSPTIVLDYHFVESFLPDDLQLRANWGWPAQVSTFGYISSIQRAEDAGPSFSTGRATFQNGGAESCPWERAGRTLRFLCERRPPDKFGGRKPTWRS